jgi:hypothetical protein
MARREMMWREMAWREVVRREMVWREVVWREMVWREKVWRGLKAHLEEVNDTCACVCTSPRWARVVLAHE